MSKPVAMFCFARFSCAVRTTPTKARIRTASRNPWPTKDALFESIPDRWRTGIGRFSVERRRIEHAAGAPGLIQAPVQLQRRLGAQISFVDLAVVAELLDHVVGPGLAQAELLADAGGRP